MGAGEGRRLVDVRAVLVIVRSSAFLRMRPLALTRRLNWRKLTLAHAVVRAGTRTTAIVSPLQASLKPAWHLGADFGVAAQAWSTCCTASARLSALSSLAPHRSAGLLMIRDAHHLTGTHARVQVLRPGVRGLSTVAEARRWHVQRCALARWPRLLELAWQSIDTARCRAQGATARST